MKKLIILLAAAMITGMTLVSCGGGSMSADEKAELINNVKQAIAASRSTDMDKAVIAIGVDSTAGVSVTDTVAATDSVITASPVEVNISMGRNQSHIVEIFGVIFIFGGPFIATVAIVWLCLHHATLRRRSREQLIAMAIERGYALPDGFYDTTKTKSRLQSGLVWLMWGIGLIIVLTCLGSPSLGTIGIIPLLVGVAKLITYYVEDRPSAKNDNDSESNNEQSLM